MIDSDKKTMRNEFYLQLRDSKFISLKEEFYM